MNNTFDLKSTDHMTKKELQLTIDRLRRKMHGLKIKVAKLKLQLTVDQDLIRKSYANLSVGK